VGREVGEVADEQDIAVVGMAGRFPGAAGVDRLWDNLVAGVESVTRLPARDLRAAGVPAAVHRQPRYVRAAALLDGHDMFDAGFFGYSPREAALMDPQQRVFLECAWTALEHAGHDPGGFPGAVGVYGGAALNSYLYATGVADELREHPIPTLLANDKDYLTSRVAYKLGLRGPAITVQTACSSSLVAVHLACQALLDGECDMALAGGVAVRVPQRAGYLAEPDGPLSPDGHTRAFDARAQGTLLGSGVAVVVLRPLPEALADGDTVYAVIKGSAVNNDGAAKADFTAPGVTGQVEVVAEALAHAGVSAKTVSYVEAHGTGTPLGDPIEIAALTRVFRRATQRRGFCAVGSVKTNVGHLDAAAGVTGLVKAVLAVRHGLIPPTLHYSAPNPRIDFAASPFFVNPAPLPWPPHDHPRRAGVTSLGIGGTNAHVVLEQAPPLPPTGPSRPVRLLALSARTPSALDAATTNLRDHLAAHPGTDLADVAYTLQVGRRAFGHRRAVRCRDVGEALVALAAPPPPTMVADRVRPVVFLLPGGGSRRPPDVADLAAAEPVFRRHLDDGLDVLRSLSDYDFAALLTPGASPPPEDYARPPIQLPLLFLVSRALAGLWESWGIRPSALLGHSLGEITAACLAGVLTLPDALDMVVTRAGLLELVPVGEMLSVALPVDEVAALADGRLDIAAVNAPRSCVVSGPLRRIETLAGRLAGSGVRVARVPVRSGGHSRMLDPILEAYEDHLAGLTLKAPVVPFLSNLTGTWITDAQATDPAYWARQLRGTVRFSDGVRLLLQQPDRVFLETGPGWTLSTLVRAHHDPVPDRPVVASLPPDTAEGSAGAAVVGALSRLWLAGVEVDWAGFAAPGRRRRVPLPTYPFDRRRHWYDDTPAPRRPVRRRPAIEPRQEPDAAVESGPDGAPRTPTERILARIWQDALGVPGMSVHDDFFEQGGTSLVLTEVMAAVNRTFHIELSLLTLIESPTVAGLAACVEAVGGTAAPRR
jgi:phthiocerol/phenolphthiocerol synthesis type-I polyketide synthase E